eukprot:3295619-Pyramimonas_sp.AAC.1
MAWLQQRRCDDDQPTHRKRQPALEERQAARRELRHLAETNPIARAILSKEPGGDSVEPMERILELIPGFP